MNIHYEKWAEMDIFDNNNEGDNFLLDRLHPNF